MNMEDILLFVNAGWYLFASRGSHLTPPHNRRTADGHRPRDHLRRLSMSRMTFYR